MHYPTQSARRFRASREFLRRPVVDLHLGCSGASVIPFTRNSAARRRRAVEAWLVTAAHRLHEVATTEAVPNLLFTFASLIMAEAMAGCAAYAEAMYGIAIESAGPVPVAMAAKQAGGPALVRAKPVAARTAVTAVARAGQDRAAWRRWYVSPVALVAALQSRIRRAGERRRTIAELRRLDERSLRDVGLTAGDIEYIARYGVWRE